MNGFEQMMCWGICLFWCNCLLWVFQISDQVGNILWGFEVCKSYFCVWDEIFWVWQIGCQFFFGLGFVSVEGFYVVGIFEVGDGGDWMIYNVLQVWVNFGFGICGIMIDYVIFFENLCFFGCVVIGECYICVGGDCKCSNQYVNIYI